MKKSGYKTIFGLYVFMFLLSALIILVGVGLAFSVVTTTDPNGNSVRSNWPQRYTSNFANYFEHDGNIPGISPNGIQSLDDNRLWIQILDENGNEVFAHNTTTDQQAHYSPTQFLELYQGEDNSGGTVCTDTVTTNAGQWTYIIGFPMNITKVTMYLNSDSFSGGKSMIIMLLAAATLLIVIGGGIFGVWIVRNMRKITQAIGQIPHRLYEPIRNAGAFGDVYESLYSLNRELLESDKALARNEKLREEWITNITHDLKTPLAPIRGYAELLADPDYSLSDENRVQYGLTILRNMEYAEKLINDLKLTYQLKNNMLPLDKKQADLTRFLKETIIEILNYPEYSDRDIAFEAAANEIVFCFDEIFLKRAFNNLIFNALIHNPQNTKIHITIQANDGISIKIADNGDGMDSAELDRLFERYYRGTNTESNTEGTGLGMTIAKQIIELHGGSIYVESETGKGTSVTIDFPLAN